MLLESCEFSEQATRFRTVNSMGGFWGVKDAKPKLFFIDLDSRNKFAFAGGHTLESSAVFFISFAIPTVVGARCKPKIAPPVVIWNAVDVINKRRRPFSGCYEPRKPVSEIVTIANSYLDVTASYFCSGSLVRVSSVKVRRNMCAPTAEHDTGVGVIRKFPFRVFSRKIAVLCAKFLNNGVSHLTLHRSYWLEARLSFSAMGRPALKAV